jgi:hypothetical protein
MTVEDAFPLLIEACRTRFGGLQALDFGIKETNGPLGSLFALSLVWLAQAFSPAYSSTLTVTGPDEIGIEFPNSGKHPTQIMAKMHAAHRAVQQGALEFIMQSGWNPALPRRQLI